MPISGAFQPQRIVPILANLPEPFGDHPAAAPMCREKQRLGKSSLCPRLLQSSVRVLAPHRARDDFYRGAEKKEGCVPSLHRALVSRDHLSTGQRGKLSAAAQVFGFSRRGRDIFWAPLLYEKRFWVVSLDAVSLQPVGLCPMLSAACLFPWLEKS